MPDFSKAFVINNDDLVVDIAVVLSQDGGLVVYYNGKYSNARKKWYTYEFELIAC